MGSMSIVMPGELNSDLPQSQSKQGDPYGIYPEQKCGKPMVSVTR